MNNCPRILAIALSLVLISLQAGWTKTLPKPNFNDQLFEAVYRVVGADGDIATGFFVTCNSDSTNNSVLITARHVFDYIESDSATIYLRRKGAESSFELFAYTFPVRDNGTPLFVVHPDSTMDIAALRVPLPAGFDVRVVGLSFLADSADFDRYDIKAGTSVNFLGYPNGMAMESSDYPLLRRGAIASHPVKPMTPFLIDGLIFRGNSGSPVLVDPGTTVINGKLMTLPPRVIGVVVNVRVAREGEPGTEPTYLHIGRVVPSTRVLELLQMFGCR